MKSLNGIFAVNKPCGISSAAYLDLIKKQIATVMFGVNSDKRKKQLRKIKMGHGGTLDPMAEGVLVVGIGDGCKRLSGFLSGNKEYKFDLLLGKHYDTFDVTGKVLDTLDYSQVTLQHLLSILPTFIGDGVMQRPPAFSALRIDGKRAYDMARQGETMPEMKARPVKIESLTVDSFDLPTITITAQVGGGCYIRSLCVDIADALGTKGAMAKLQRTRQGQFGLSDCVPIDDKAECLDLDELKSVLK